MKATDIARLKKQLKGPLGKRLHQASVAQGSGATRLRSKSGRKEAGKLLSTDLGLTPATRRAFAEVVAKESAQAETRIKKLTAEAQKHARTEQKALKQALIARAKSVKALATQQAATQGTSFYYLLERPFLIWPSFGLQIDATYSNQNSFVKVQKTIDNIDAAHAVRFYYLWTNPRNSYSVINIDAPIIFNGTGQASAGGGITADDRYAKLVITGQLEVLEWWNQPPTSPQQQPDQTASVLTPPLEASQEGWFELGDIEFKAVFRGYDINYRLMVVPPLATVVFACSAHFDSTCGTSDSQTIIDFKTGNFQITSPFAIVNLLS